MGECKMRVGERGDYVPSIDEPLTTIFLKSLIEFHLLKPSAMPGDKQHIFYLPVYVYACEVDHCNEYRWAITTKLLHNFSKFYDCLSYFLLE